MGDARQDSLPLSAQVKTGVPAADALLERLDTLIGDAFTAWRPVESGAESRLLAMIHDSMAIARTKIQLHIKKEGPK